MNDGHKVRGDLAFGIPDYDLEQLRELYEVALGLLAESQRHVDMYRAYAEQHAFGCAELRVQLQRKQMLLDRALTANAKRGDA